MTAHPNDTATLLDELRRNAQAPMDRFDRLHGMGGFPEYGEDERPFPDEVLKLLDLLAAAEHRATRAEAQSAVRGRAVVIYRERAREAETRIKAWEKQYDHDLAQADLIADQAEARVRDLAQEVKDERGACLDQMEQVRIRDARIKAVQDELVATQEYGAKLAHRKDEAEARIRAVLTAVQEWESADVRHEVAPIMRAASTRIRRALDD